MSRIDVDEFWRIVERTHAAADGDMEAKCDALKAEVGRLSGADAKAFARQFDEMMDRAYSWALWGAAYVIRGGCSDEAFADFRASLISRGRAAFEKALASPDSLAAEDLDDEEDWTFEGYQYAASEAVEAVSGAVHERAAPHPTSPSGEEWSEDDVYDRYPRLAAKYR